MKRKLNIFYQYKDGRYLQANYMGDGEYGLVLTNEMNRDCLFSDDWSLSEILDNCDSVYDDNYNFIDETLEESDFTKGGAEIKIS